VGRDLDLIRKARRHLPSLTVLENDDGHDGRKLRGDSPALSPRRDPFIPDAQHVAKKLEPGKLRESAVVLEEEIEEASLLVTPTSAKRGGKKQVALAGAELRIDECAGLEAQTIPVYRLDKGRSKSPAKEGSGVRRIGKPELEELVVTLVERVVHEMAKDSGSDLADRIPQ